MATAIISHNADVAMAPPGAAIEAMRDATPSSTEVPLEVATVSIGLMCLRCIAFSEQGDQIAADVATVIFSVVFNRLYCFE